MLVKDWMSRPVITVDENDSIQGAMGLLKKHNIRMLPVFKSGKLTGIITDRDLKRASASDASTLEIHELLYLLTKIKVREIMTKNPITVPLDFTVEETAEVLLQHKINGVPVMDKEGKLVGVITQTDLFRVIISLTGVGKRGIQFGFKLEDRPGSIKDVADVIRAYGGKMVSILTSYDGAPKGYRWAYIRIYDIDRSKLENLKQDLKTQGPLLYMVDHRENRREIY
ncbi:MAG: CBS domain-containing protein [Deltaproteobacteria bacterium]|nr:CBS domain-containing protein [Deltaproteobacteria bacterium]MBW1960012.1 CBS domain-containing protein [Deltaproteobacteria bacterium]MBW1995964.1 CBS domain-containing protein [Deltaproteobacteria bacterium]MBW2151204.1 CBS domain-containing protein [Deltaproteobacteria bacterium]